MTSPVRKATIPVAHHARDPIVPPRLALGAAVVAISSAAILIRWTGAPPLVVGAYRLAYATPLFWLAARFAPAPLWVGWTRARVAAGLAAAVLLAAHFGLWIASLGLTSVASSVLLVSTQPIFVALLGRAVLREPVAARAAAGIVLALAGTVAITGGNFRGPEGAWRGDLLALGGALAMALHTLLVRHLRPHVNLVPLMSLETPVAAALLALGAVLAGEPLTGYAPGTHALFLLLALVPTGIGHTLLNWALRYRKAYEVNVAVLGEPVGATLLAFALLGERPALHVVAGGALVLIGILLAWSSSASPTAAGSV